MEIAPHCPEHLETINQMAEDIVKTIIRQENEAGITLNRIVIGIRISHHIIMNMSTPNYVYSNGAILQVAFLWAVQWLFIWDTDFCPKLLVFLVYHLSQMIIQSYLSLIHISEPTRPY